MIPLYWVERAMAGGQTDLIAQACGAKKLVVYGAANVEFRDGSAAGPLIARIITTANGPLGVLSCETNEIFRFNIKPYIVSQGACTVGMLLLGNPVGPAST